MIGNVFYGVVASSFVVPDSGSGDGSQPSGPPSLTFVDQDAMSGGGQKTLDIDLNFDTVGTYIVAAFGQAGNKFSDNVLALDYIDFFDVEEIYTFTNGEFETVRFVKVKVTSAGVHSVRLSNTHGNGIYRAGAACWKLEGDLVAGNFTGYRIDGSDSINTNVFADGAVIAVVLGRDGSPGDLTDNSFTGVADTDQPLTLIASGQDFYYGLFSEDGYSDDASVLLTHSPAGNTSRAEVGILSIEPVFEETVTLDETRVPSGYTLSSDELTVENTSGGSDYRRWVPAEKLLPTEFLGVVYWEVEVQATQTGDLNGFCGVFPIGEIDGPDGYDTGNNPVSLGGIGYRGNGSIWAEGSQQTTGPESYENGDILMLAFRPSSGALWVGKNGVWHQDPDNDPPSHATPLMDSTGWLAIVHGRDQGDELTLRSTQAQFDYPVPSVAVSYGGDLTSEAEELAAFNLDVWFELGGDSSLTVAQLEIWIEEDIT